MAFELYTDICPQRCKKWRQEPDMIEGVNMKSCESPQASSVLRADDFISDGRPITDVHWWGSYINWYHDYYYSETNPPPKPWPSPAAFRLSWHEEDPANPCLPGELLEEVVVPIQYCHETFYGSLTQYWITQSEVTNYEHEFQYYVDLLDLGFSEGPWMETNEVHYWLDIQALYTNYVYYPWGWKITTTNDEQECDSVVFEGEMDYWTNTFLITESQTHPREGQPFDLAFELTTTNIPDTNSLWAVDVKFTNIHINITSDFARMWTTGYCGCGKQILQESTNLLDGPGGWLDVQSNLVPRPENVWETSPAATQRFYRILQRQ